MKQECSTGHLIVRQLEAEGVSRVYCVPGESYLDVLDGLHDSAIHTVVCRQEGGAGYMAVAEGRMTGRPGVAMVTRGPGAANIMAAIHTAYQDATPLVVFVGLIPTEVRGREAFQEFDPNAWFGSTAKKVLVLDNPQSAADVVADAMHTALSGRPGPVIVGLPEDQLLVQTSGAPVASRPVAEPGSSEGELAAIEEIIARAERPLLIVGGEMWDQASSQAITDWSAGWGMGVIADYRAYDAIDHSSENYLGSLGNMSAPITRQVFQEADVQVYLGCVRSDVMTNSYEIGCAPEKTVVINRDPAAHGHFGPLDRLVVSTTRRFAATVATLESCAPTAPDWVIEARRAFRDWRVPPVPRGEEASEYVDMDLAFETIRRHLPEDAILAYGAGNHTGWAVRYLHTHSFPSVVAPRNGSMGFGIPAAVAAALVHPERPVFSIAGDGCFLMNGQEFSTAVNEGVNITVVINDNSVYGTIVAHQEKHYPGRPSATSLGNPDFAAWARSFGAFGVRVERTEDFEAAFVQALQHPGPAIVHALTDPAVRVPRGSDQAVLALTHHDRTPELV